MSPDTPPNADKADNTDQVQPRAREADAHLALQRCLADFAPGLSLPAALLPDLTPLLRLKRLRAGQVLMAQGAPAEAFYAVAEGEIEARFTGLDGGVSVLEHIQAPRLFGLAAFACQHRSAYEALARTDCAVLPIGRAAYHLLMDRAPGFARALLQEFAQRYDGTLHLLAASRHARSADRIGQALQQVDRELGVADPERPGWRRIDISQSGLAALAHVSRQSVNEWLQRARQQGQLEAGYRCLWLRQR